MRLVSITADVASPVLIGYIITLFSNGAPTETILFWAAILTGSILFSPLFDQLSGYNNWIIAFRCSHDFRMDTIEKLRHTGLSFWQTHDRGNVIKVIDRTFEHLLYLTGGIIHIYLPFTGRVLGIFFSVSFFDPVITLLLLIDVILFTLNLKIMMPKEQTAGLAENVAQEKVSGRIFEYMTNYKTVVYLNLFDRQEQELHRLNEAAYTAYRKRETYSGIKWYLNNQIHAIMLAAIFGYTIYQVTMGRIEVGVLATIVLFSMRLAETMGWAVWELSEMVRYINSIRRYQETFENVTDKKTVANSMYEKQGIFENLVLKNVNVQQADRETLKNISLRVQASEKIAIVGYTGSGKTTLIDIILKANTEFGGTVHLNGEDFQKMSVQDIATIFSIVPQEVQLFKESLKGNIVITDNKAEEAKLTSVIKTAALDDLVAKLPKGVDSPIHEGSTNISGGERQRIGIARALLQNHPVLVLDEATASLDPKTERTVVTNIIRDYPETTLLYITDKYSLLNLFDHILVMNDGSIIEEGSFDQLIAKGGLFKDLYEAAKVI